MNSIEGPRTPAVKPGRITQREREGGSEDSRPKSAGNGRSTKTEQNFLCLLETREGPAGASGLSPPQQKVPALWWLR